MKLSLIRLPDWAGAEIEKIALEKGLAFATTVRCIVVDHLKENAPVTASKQETDAASPPKEVPAC